MNHSEWPYHDLTWWINQIDQTVVPACGIPFEEPQDPESYMMTVKQRLESVLSSDNPCLTQRNPDAARTLLFRAKALKKWRLNVPGHQSRDRAAEAKRGFLLRNADAARYHAGIYADVMRELLHYWLPEPSEEQCQNGRFGPGACAERRSHPQRYIALYEWCSNEHWPEDPSGLADAQLGTARLCAVPKDWDKDRLITVEPSYSTFEQQRVRKLILESIHSGPLRGTAMDLGYTDGQAIQRGIALRASRTGRQATIDLSDASDGISWTAVQEVFPEWLVRLLFLSRTPRIVHDATGGQPLTTDLHIFAGMGNATTFPVETLYFSALMESIRITHFPSSSRKSRVSVFGDDIICDSDVASVLLEHSQEEIPGIKVNRSKSFLGASPWRESCGIYAYDGVDVTVPKVDGYTPSWCGAQGVSDLCSRLLTGPFIGLAHAIVECRPTSLENLPFSIEGYPAFSYSGLPYDILPQTRWNTRYQRREAKVTVRCERNAMYSCCDQPGVYPPASVWLTASLLGELHQDNHGRVSFPLREIERTVWRRVTPSVS